MLITLGTETQRVKYNRVNDVSKIQLVVYYQSCILIG